MTSDHKIEFIVENATDQQVLWIIAIIELIVKAMGLSLIGNEWESKNDGT